MHLNKPIDRDVMTPTQSKIMEVVKEAGEPMSIGEIAKKVGVSWATAKTNVLELSQNKMLNTKKVGKNWIVWIDASNQPIETCSTYRRRR
jgi:predicted DNA-binding transcriptional regulator